MIVIRCTVLVLLSAMFASPLGAHPLVDPIASTGWLDPADYGAREDKTEAVTTTKAWIKCIADAIAQRKSITFKGDHLLNTDAIVITDQLVIRGNGVRVSRLFTADEGVLLRHDCEMKSSTGRGITLSDFGVFCEDPTTSAGSIGIQITNTGSANNAFSWLSHVVVSGFHDGIDVHNQYFYSITECYIDNYRRYGIRVSNDWTFDAGDGVIRENWIQPIQNTSGTGYDPGGSNIRVEQNPGMRITGNKIFPGHAIGIHIYANGARSGESIPSGMYMITNNLFDSFGANRDAIVIDSDWRKGGAGGGVTGNKLMNIQIVANNLSNCARLVDVRILGGGLQHLSVIDNTSFGGGGIKVSGAVDGFFVNGNHFDNRAHGAGVASGFGPSKPIEITGSVTNGSLGSNSFVGYRERGDTDAMQAPPGR